MLSERIEQPRSAPDSPGLPALPTSVRLTLRPKARRYLRTLTAGQCIVLLWGVDNDTGGSGWIAITLSGARLRTREAAPFITRLEDVPLVIPACDRARMGELDGRALDYCRGALILE